MPPNTYDAELTLLTKKPVTATMMKLLPIRVLAAQSLGHAAKIKIHRKEKAASKNVN
jgi:hypothetical protein